MKDCYKIVLGKFVKIEKIAYLPSGGAIVGKDETCGTFVSKESLEKMNMQIGGYLVILEEPGAGHSINYYPEDVFNKIFKTYEC